MYISLPIRRDYAAYVIFPWLLFFNDWAHTRTSKLVYLSLKKIYLCLGAKLVGTGYGNMSYLHDIRSFRNYKRFHALPSIQFIDKNFKNATVDILRNVCEQHKMKEKSVDYNFNFKKQDSPMRQSIPPNKQLIATLKFFLPLQDNVYSTLTIYI